MRTGSFALLLVVLLGGCAASQPRQASPKATDSAVFSIVPGAPIYAEATIRSDGSITLVKVLEIVDPARTITFSFTQSERGTMLAVRNPLGVTIKYHLNMIDFQGKPHRTSSCPVRAGLSVFESWPHPIPEIRVSNAHVASRTEEGLCIY